MPALTPVATPQQIQQLLGLASDDDLNGRLGLLVEMSVELVEAHLNRRLVKGSYTEQHSGGRVIALRAYPVESVERVTMNGDEAPYDYLVRDSGLLFRRDGWPEIPGGYEVTYTGGLDPIPKAILQAVALMVSTMAGVTDNKGQLIASESLSDYRVSYVRMAETAGIGGLCPAAAWLLAPYRNMSW